MVAVLSHLRTVVLSPANQTWRELLVAARADADLRTALLPARESLQEQMLDAAAELWGDRLPADDLAAVLSIVVNMLDGLAFSALDPDPRPHPADRRAGPAPARRDDRPPLPPRRPDDGQHRHDFTPDAIVVGAGLAGLVATHELALAGKRVLVLDQENRDNLGGQALWSLGGLFFVDSPEQRRMGIKDSPELAWQDWQGSAQFDRLGDGTDGPGRGEDFWPRQWAKAYVEFAHEEKRDYLRALGLKSLPFVGWAERGDGRADRPRQLGAPLPPHLGHRPRGGADLRGAGGAGRGSRARTLRVPPPGRRAGRRGRRGRRRTRHRAGRGRLRARREVQPRRRRRLRAPGPRRRRHLRRHRPQPRADAPQLAHRARRCRARAHDLRRPAHVDGRMQGISEAAGATMVNKDRMWAYVEGIHNWDPVWPDHAIRILPGPSSMWFDANGRRLEGMSGVPGADSIGAMKQILAAGHDYSWFVLTQSIIEKEFALSGSEQNPDITGKDLKFLAQSRLAKGAPGPVEAFKENGVDFVVADDARRPRRAA